MGARSTGCISCKARRVKCDESHPACKRCQKAGVLCKGYPSLYEFVDETARVKRSSTIAQSQQENLLGLQRIPHVLYHTSQIPQRSQSIPISASIPLTGFKHTVFVSYLVSKLSEEDGGRPATVIWIEGISRQSRNALNALAAMVFGQAHQSMETIVDARKAYGKALTDLRAALSYVPSSMTFDTLASVTALCMYESGFDDRTDVPWYHHSSGLASLMQARGPLQYQNRLENSLFLTQRIILVSRAILSGTETFLSHHDWKTIPWQNNPASKGPSDHLIDIFCDVASHQAKLKTCNKETLYMQIVGLEVKIFASLQELDNWWEDWWQKNPDCCREIHLESRESFNNEINGDFFTSALEFNTLKTAFSVATHDATRILLLLLSRTTLQIKVQYGQNTTPDERAQHVLSRKADVRHSPLQGITSDIKGLAREICQTFDYCSRNSNQQWMCSYSCMLALDIAYSTLPVDSTEAKWIRLRTARQRDSLYETRSPTAILGIKVLPSCQVILPESEGSETIIDPKVELSPHDWKTRS